MNASSTSSPAPGSRDWLLARLIAIVEQAMQGEPVLARDGTPTGQLKYDSTAANRALELIGKLQGFFSERAQPEEEQKSDDELRTELTHILASLAELGIEGGARAPAQGQHGGAGETPRAD
ncbi:MAG TPA: hypothetical protein VFB45_10310 [Pseudolabrys sp.]|nr:hypothetical protein [Pseudolabrys sp.]